VSRAEREISEVMRSVESEVKAARQLFAGDRLSVRRRLLSLPFEEEEKQLLAISESFNLRGPEVDALHSSALAEARTRAVEGALDDVREMHLSIIDGIFPGDVLASQNLTFSPYTAPNNILSQRPDPLKPQDLQISVMKQP